VSHQIWWNILREHNWGVPSAYIKFIYYVTYILEYLIVLQGHTCTGAVEEGVDVLEVPIEGRPVTTEEVSVKRGINRNTQKYVSNEKTCEYACMNNF